MIFKRKKQTGIFDDLPVAPPSAPAERHTISRTGRRAMLIPDSPYTDDPRADLMLANTGKQREQWLKIVSQAEVSEAKANQIASFLISNYRVQKWWANSIALMYLKWRNETKSSSAESKVLRVTGDLNNTVSLSYNLLNSASRYGDQFERFLKLVDDEKLIIKFQDGTRATIYLRAKGESTNIIIEHEFISSPVNKKSWTKFWTEFLLKLMESSLND